MKEKRSKQCPKYSAKCFISSASPGMSLALSLALGSAGLALAGEEQSGMEVYMQNCVVCHDADGSGLLPGVPDLTEKNKWKNDSVAQLLERVKQGIQGTASVIPMPAKGGNPELTDLQLEAALVYMKKNIQ